MNKWLEYYLIRRSKLFDYRYYLKENKDVLRSDVDPLEHFIKYGWKEERNPSGSFNTSFYLSKNPDVQRVGVNPLVHYIRHGQKEGRKTQGNLQIVQNGWNEIDFTPLVSIIVPSFNHENFLEERLNSIYEQTYGNFEVILLDDCSTDGSRDILRKYEKKYPETTRCDFNEINSKSPFSQWKKGINLAQGDLIWIAESDDYCEKDFLDKLVPFFLDEAIMLAYAHTVFVDIKSKDHPFAFETYVSQISTEKWNSSYIETAHNEVNNALGFLNTIPNVSSAIFRNVGPDFPLFNNPEWEKMKVCGDWLFYLYLIRAGKIAYSVDTHAYYRIHSDGSSKKAQIEDIYYKEHEIVANNIAHLYKVDTSLLIRLDKRLFEYYQVNMKNGNRQDFQKLFDITRAKEIQILRQPNVLITIYGFAFGGGEILPIRLANALYRQGVSVTVLNGDFEERQNGVRTMLNKSIPVINYNSSLDLFETINNLGIEIMHSHHASMEHLLAISTLTNNRQVKHIATTHGMYEMMENFPLWTKEILKSVDHWVYIAEKNLEPFLKTKKYIPNKFTKMENGVEQRENTKIELSEFGIVPDSFVLCVAGRALEEKGWYEAIKATKLARDATGKDIHLLLIGEGPVYTQLKSNMSVEYIHLLGFKSNVSDYLYSSNLGLLPSYFRGESYPLVITECFLAGIPVIATRIGETEAMMTTSDSKIAGSLIDIKESKIDPKDLAAEISRMVLDSAYYEECCILAAQLKNRFNIDTIAKKYLDIYKKVLSS